MSDSTYLLYLAYGAKSTEKNTFEKSIKNRRGAAFFLQSSKTEKKIKFARGVEKAARVWYNYFYKSDDAIEM